MKRPKNLKNLWVGRDGTVIPMPGSHIVSIIIDAIKFAKRKRRTIEFEHNGVTVSVTGDSSPVLILRDWVRARHGCISKSVGPYPVHILSDEELEDYAKVTARRRLVELLGLMDRLAEAMATVGGKV